MDWARKIKELRFLENLKQDALAQQLEVSQASISQWERGVSQPPPHIKAKLRHRLMVSPGERMSAAMRTSVVESPNLCGLLSMRDGDVVVELLSHDSYGLFPLLTPADIGKPLRGKLGPDVDRLLDRLVGEGAFAGRVQHAKLSATARRNGLKASGIMTVTPVCAQESSCLLRCEVRLLGPGEDVPALERITHFSWDEVDA
ncbi:MAG: helix-turn-helix transcriptional regulator [Pseudomonadota bacterium]|nr:helix-turn-helix transcriptional regulator [Pseudomonadota bacterium]